MINFVCFLFQTDIIVNSTNRELYLDKQRISRSILNVAGFKLQEECEQQFGDGISYGDVAATMAHGYLKCKRVYHVAVPPWGTPDIDAQQVQPHTINKSIGVFLVAWTQCKI